MDFYPFIIKTLEEAGAMVLELRSKAFETSEKHGDPRDIVTSVDIAVNEYITGEIKKNFPAHAIHSEEASEAAKDEEYLWTIDPIDGSSNFSRGIPHFAVCLGLLHMGVPVAGGVYNPVTRELFSFKKGEGAFLNGAPIHVSDSTELKNASTFFHAGRKPEGWEWGGQGYRTLLEHAKKTSNFGSTSLDTCFVAAGRIEASVYGTMATLDVACAVGILEEAGGFVAGADGARVGLVAQSQKTYAVNNESILTQLRAIV